MRFTKVIPWILLGLFPLLPPNSVHDTTAARTDGARPRNLVVTPGGDAVVVTSLGSTSISQTRRAQAAGPWTAPTHINVFYKSWGICLIDGNTAVVTHPYETKLSLVKRPDANSLFAYDSSIDLGDGFRYSTEIIPNPNDSNRVLVANRGMSPEVPGARSWNHAVYEVDVVTGGITRTFITEREPRALAVSPDGERLFVGHIQGALGGVGLVNNHPLADNRDDNGNFRDGGSVLVYDLTSPLAAVMPETDMRFGVGSPVRGMTVSLNDDGSYVLYYTHVGDNANSEKPVETPKFFGGRQTPHILTNITFNAAHVPQLVQDAVFGHQPDLDPVDLDPANPLTVHAAVLHEKICIRDYEALDTRTREVWVSNSGSGTVSRAALDANGHFVVEGIPLSVTYVRLNRDFSTHDMDLVHVPATYAVLKKINGGIANHAYVTSPNSKKYTSNPRGIVYDPANDYVWVATQFDNELYALQGTGTGIDNHERLLLSAGPSVTEAERDFFAFGRGFEFREGLGDDLVGNLTCATCHVEAHSDGKVRLTSRGLDNRFPPESRGVPGDIRKPVTVPSNHDVGQTEWIFFEGLKTIRDGDHGSFVPCLYCGDSGFFDTTEDFTNVVESPLSPYCPTGTLNDNQRHGRYLFEAMNCSRCHMGPVAEFDKTNVPLLPQGTDQAGPTPATLTTANRILHDPTQSFITERLARDPPGAAARMPVLPEPGGAARTPELPEPGGAARMPELPGPGDAARIPELPNPFDDFSSARNVSDVGTRVNIFVPGERDGFWNGINTPALAGAWDNAPFMHDGRYRELEEVLKHTWINPADGKRSAPLVLNGIPDNSFNQLPSPPLGDIVQTPRDPDGDGVDDGDNHLPTLFPFGTHAPGKAGWVSVYDYLNGNGVTAPYAGAYDDLEAFLRALSSKTDPCAGADDFFTNLQVDVKGNVATATWQSVAEVVCNVVWGSVDSVTNFASTPLGTTHSLVLDLPRPADYEINVIARVKTICGTRLRSKTTFSRVDPLPGLQNHMSQNFPNPFNPTTAIEFTIENDGHVKLSIYDIAGKLVRTLVNERRTANSYSVQWNGIDNEGNPVSSGVYFYRIEAPGFTQTRKLVQLK